MRRLQQNYRRGAAAIQVALLLAVVAVGIIVTVQRMSTSTNTQLGVTSEGLADPSALRRHFGGDGSEDQG